MSVTRDHVLVMPRGFIALRIVQLVVSVAILGLAAYGIYYLSFDGVDLTIFSAIITIIITIYIIVATTGAPVIYNYWAILGLDIFLIIFWIISFSLLAAGIAPYFGYVDTTDTCSYVYNYTCYYKRATNLIRRDTYVSTYLDAMAAAAGLGGLEFLLFLLSLIMTSVALHRHRMNGGHCMPSRHTTANDSPATRNNKEELDTVGLAPDYADQTLPIHQVSNV